MDYRKTDAPTNTQTRNITEFAKGTNNIYESVVIMSRRANQISVAMKNDLQKKLQEFASANENLDEVFENREQIEISQLQESSLPLQSKANSKICRRSKKSSKAWQALNSRRS